MKRGLTLFGFVVLLALGSCWWAYPSASLRYEITVEVEAEGQLYTGSSVHEETLRRQPQMLAAPPESREFKVEAVAVDIADRGTLFLLLTGTRGQSNEPFSPEHGYHVDPEQFVNVVFEIRASSAQAVRSLPYRVIDDEVPFNQLPMMVRFDDISDPTTVALVNPYDLAARFGEGVQLRRVHVQTTRARVTDGIEERLPWFNTPHPPGTLSSGSIYGDRPRVHDFPPGHSVQFSNFRQGFG